MSNFIHNKTASFFVTLLIGIIILSFMFTGYQSLQGSPNAVGKVGDQLIKPEEFDQEYKRQLDFYKQIMGGGEISAKQAEGLKIRESALKNIVQRKLMIIFANDIGAFPADEEVKKEIKTLPYFLTNGQFDITRYKGILNANKLSPQEFELDVINQLKLKNTQNLFATFPLSKGYMNDLQTLRAEKVGAEIIQITKNNLRKFIEVSTAELEKFSSVETNQKRIKSIFDERKESLSKPEEVKARHILLTTEGKDDAAVKMEIEKIAKEVTPANFSKLADKYTQDPSGKGKGGDLGSFTHGRMVPEFDQVAFNTKPGTISAPVKTNFGYHIIFVESKTAEKIAQLNDEKNKIATELIQKDRVEDIKKLTVDISNNLKKSLEASNEKEVKSIVEKYKLQYTKGSINRLDGASNGANLSQENMNQIFSANKDASNVILFDDGGVITMIKTLPGPVATTLDETAKIAESNASLKNALSRKMMDSVLKQLEADTKVKIYSQMFQE